MRRSVVLERNFMYVVNPKSLQPGPASLKSPYSTRIKSLNDMSGHLHHVLTPVTRRLASYNLHIATAVASILSQ